MDSFHTEQKSECTNMMNEKHLLDEYNKLLAQSPEDIDSDNCSELFVVISETDWIRVLLLKTIQKEVSTISIEVELSLPKCVASGDLQNKNTLLSDMVAHLEYLQKLYEIGFELEVMRTDCLWTAAKTLDSVPSPELCASLTPP